MLVIKHLDTRVILDNIVEFWPQEKSICFIAINKNGFDIEFEFETEEEVKDALEKIEKFIQSSSLTGNKILEV